MLAATTAVQARSLVLRVRHGLRRLRRTLLGERPAAAVAVATTTGLDATVAVSAASQCDALAALSASGTRLYFSWASVQDIRTNPSIGSMFNAATSSACTRFPFDTACAAPASSRRALQSTNMWTIVLGSAHCSLTNNGACVTDGVGNHANMERCTIRAQQALYATATYFVTESCCDRIMIGSSRFSGTVGPANVAMSAARR